MLAAWTASCVTLGTSVDQLLPVTTGSSLPGDLGKNYHYPPLKLIAPGGKIQVK